MPPSLTPKSSPSFQWLEFIQGQFDSHRISTSSPGAGPVFFAVVSSRGQALPFFKAFKSFLRSFHLLYLHLALPPLPGAQRRETPLCLPPSSSRDSYRVNHGHYRGLHGFVYSNFQVFPSPQLFPLSPTSCFAPFASVICFSKYGDKGARRGAVLPFLFCPYTTCLLAFFYLISKFLAPHRFRRHFPVSLCTESSGSGFCFS